MFLNTFQDLNPGLLQSNNSNVLFIFLNFFFWHLTEYSPPNLARQARGSNFVRPELYEYSKIWQDIGNHCILIVWEYNFTTRFCAYYRPFKYFLKHNFARIKIIRAGERQGRLFAKASKRLSKWLKFLLLDDNELFFI